MRNLVSSTLPNLIGGVSQQPWAVRLPTQSEEQINCIASVTDFLRRRPATRHIAEIIPASEYVDDTAMHIINRDADEKYIVIASPQRIRVFDFEGREKTVINNAPYYLDVASPAKHLRFLTINDYTFIVNTTKTVEMLPELSPEREHEALVFIKQASYNTTYTLTIDGISKSFTTLDGVAPADQPADKISSTEIATSLANAFNSSVYDIRVKNATLWIRRVDRRDFSVSVTDTRSNTHTSLCKSKIQTFSDLLKVAPRGFITEVIGDAGSSFDNYYVQFEPDDENESFGAGVWKETTKPGIPYKLDNSTMPHTLVRQPDGTFLFGPEEWDGRTAGDEENAPTPSFVGRNISGMIYYRNRLSFLSWENLIMSKVGKFFTFFASTVTALLDDDPIDVAASHIRATNLEYAVPYTGGLLLFSDSTQFILEHDSVLATSSVSIRAVTEFEMDMNTAPVSSGKTVFFPTMRGDYAGVREYYTLPENSDQNDASDVTAHVPHYLRGNIVKMCCSTNEDILFVHTDKDRHKMYIYKYFWNGSQKTQSCWGTWEFGGGEVLTSGTINTTLFLIVKRDDGGVFLESCSFEPGHKDEGEAFEYCVDRKITESKVIDFSYDPAEKTTTLTLPYSAESAIVITRSGGVKAEGVQMETVSTNGNQITVKGELNRGDKLFIGYPYESRYTFTTLALREKQQTGGAGSAIIEGRLQLRRLTVNCAETGYVEFTVSPMFREASTYIFTGRELGHGSNKLYTIPLYTGSIQVPVSSQNNQVTIEMRTDSPLPCALVNASWEGFYNTRSVRH